MNREEAIKILKTAVENDKEHRIITIYDKKPLLRDAIEVVLKALEDKKDNMQVIYGGRRFGTEGMVVKDYISKDKIKEKIEKYRKKSEKLHSQELWHEPEDSIKDFKYNHYLEAYKELLEEEK